MIDLGTRLELFVDEYLIERLRGARRELRHPALMPREPGASRVCYSTVLFDHGVYRRYQREVRSGYRGEQFDGHPGELTCYLESDDGVRWRRPRLGLIEVKARAPTTWCWPAPICAATTSRRSWTATRRPVRRPATRPWAVCTPAAACTPGAPPTA